MKLKAQNKKHAARLRIGSDLTREECRWLDIRDRFDIVRLNEDDFVKLCIRRKLKYNPKTKRWIKK